MSKSIGTYVEIDWIALRWRFFAFSGLVVAVCLGSLATKGFNYSIDFTGGTMVQLTFEKPTDLASVRAALSKAGFPEAQPQSFSASTFAVLLKGGEQDAGHVDALLKGLAEATADNPYRIDRKEFVGPSVGRHLKRQAMTAIVLALLAIIVYVAFRFQSTVWGAGGVIALAHDVIVTAGIFSLLGKEVDLVIVAAFLTIAGYSINDTIVIFDRMREKMRTARHLDLTTLFNSSLNEMQSRTVITNGMVFAVVLMLFFFGGQVIHDFAFAMVIGAITGTYSTVAIAVPLAYELSGRKTAGSAPRGQSLPSKPAAKRP